MLWTFIHFLYICFIKCGLIRFLKSFHWRFSSVLTYSVKWSRSGGQTDFCSAEDQMKTTRTYPSAAAQQGDTRRKLILLKPHLIFSWTVEGRLEFVLHLLVWSSYEASVRVNRKIHDHQLFTCIHDVSPVLRWTWSPLSNRPQYYCQDFPRVETHVLWSGI